MSEELGNLNEDRPAYNDEDARQGYMTSHCNTMAFNSRLAQSTGKCNCKAGTNRNTLVTEASHSSGLPPTVTLLYLAPSTTVMVTKAS